MVTFSSVSAEDTISSDISVKAVILSGIWNPGLINSSNLSVITPSSILTAPISIITSPDEALKPVVSVSNTTKVEVLRGASIGSFTICTTSSTSVSSVPYNPLKCLVGSSIFLLWALISW